MMGSSQGLSSAFHPATNGATERMNMMVECYVQYQQSDWADLFPFAEVAYNNMVHNSMGFTPFHIAGVREFVPILECPQVATEDMSTQERVAQMQTG